MTFEEDLIKKAMEHIDIAEKRTLTGLTKGVFEEALYIVLEGYKSKVRKAIGKYVITGAYPSIFKEILEELGLTSEDKL